MKRLMVWTSEKIADEGGMLMIHVLHLLWIVPLAGAVGFMTAALLAAGKDRR